MKKRKSAAQKKIASFAKQYIRQLTLTYAGAPTECYVEYFAEDVDYYTSKLDDVLTLYRASSDDRIIGARLTSRERRPGN